MLSPKLEQTVQNIKMQILFNRDAAAFYVPYCYLPVTESTSIKRVTTDGRQITINPEFFETLDPDEAVGVFFHEITHNMLGHTAVDFPQVSDEEVMKQAKEIAVNNLVLDCGLRLSKDYSEVDRKYSGMSTLQIYKDLHDEKQQNPNQQNQPPGCGCCVPAPADGQGDPNLPDAPTQSGAAQKMAEAQQALKQAGNSSLSEKIGELIKDLVKPEIDWAEELRDSFVKSFDGDVLDLSNPNKQCLAQGIYIPKYKDEAIESLCIALDLSCSLTDEELAKGQAVIDEVRQLYEIETTSIIAYNTRVTSHKTFQQYEEINIGDMEGRGGTRGDCVFEHLKEKSEVPFTLLMITDTEDRIETKSVDVPYPVIWLNTGGGEPFSWGGPPDFGKIVSI